MKWGVAAVAAALCFTSTAGTADEIKLTFATNAGPNRSPHPEVSLPWAERINEAGKGLVNVNVVQGFTIVTPQTFYARVQNDVTRPDGILHPLVVGHPAHVRWPQSFGRCGQRRCGPLLYRQSRILPGAQPTIEHAHVRKSIGRKHPPRRQAFLAVH